ncbi:transcriptional regulator PpsR [Falsiroseomonas tokyonensis]|uniref:Transcriptional regulator PpsR n=1 Tax=Falsiroseomonas tokyonensis TaxID=430521 RepID=A0ABV7BNA8_9PROT|nr:transcriptional regulator PpsR [Falsiroseomonas tokyonensis]MBU8536554.1 transcriptional regulator PpsR [Falsiroseomonas tokyonensis]
MTRVAVIQPDITLSLDWEGVIRDASLSDAIPAERVQEWLGRPWMETVGEIAGLQVRRMVEDARASGVSAYLQVTQRFPSGLELPIEYTTVRLGGQAGLIAVGKNLQAVAELQSRLVAAQQAREQDYWKLREIETRSRLLFDASSEAVLVIAASTLRIVEANPAAIRELGMAPGWNFADEVAPRDRAALRDVLMRAREQGRAPGIMVHLGAEATPWLLRASLMARTPGPVFLIQLSPAAAAAQPRTTTRRPGEGAERLLEDMPDGFVAIDAAGAIRRANRAFLDLAQAGTEASIIGEKLDRWLAQPGMDLGVLLATIAQHGEVRLFPTQLTGNLGSETEVEISGCAVTRDGVRMVGLIIRDIGRRVLPSGEAAALRTALGMLANDVGRVPLPIMVRNTAALVERACIEQALRLANGNRTAAADALGLSRQSLYAKLERYELGEDREATEDRAR